MSGGSGVQPKIALVTGGGTGVGRAIAKGLGAAGYRVVISGRRAEILEKLSVAAAEQRFRMPVGETVPLSGAIQLITELEAGRKLGGKGLVAME